MDTSLSLPLIRRKSICIQVHGGIATTRDEEIEEMVEAPGELQQAHIALDSTISVSLSVRG
jgi:hypothetical protein